MRYYLSSVLILMITSRCFNQGILYPDNEISSYFSQRLEILSGNLFEDHLTLSPSTQERRLQSLLKYVNDKTLSQAAYREIKQYLYIQNEDYFYNHIDSIGSHHFATRAHKPILKFLFKKPAYLFSFFDTNFYLTINPVLEFKYGVESNNDEALFTNKRGVEFQLGLDNKIFFYSKIIETQISSPRYFNDFINTNKAYPGAGFLKSFSSSTFNFQNGYDYLLAEAHIGFKAHKYIDIQLGHGKHFIGSGIRSLFLSDFSPPYFYLSLKTKFWKINYQNIFAELNSEGKYLKEPDRLLDKKYMTSHYLSINILKNWNVGIFESVVFSRKNQYELQYLNPLILYRFVEQALGSPDNVLLGLHSNIILYKKINLYGQFLIDEFKLKEIVQEEKGWWGNKYAFQLGFKYPELFRIKNVDLQLEINAARPYTYSYRDSVSNYTHYRQPLAHPLGSNFKEGILTLTFRPNIRWLIQPKFIVYEKGKDIDELNYGGNILRPNKVRVQDYGNFFGQGDKERVQFAKLDISYMLFHNAWIDLDFNFRKSTSNQYNLSTPWIQFGLRWNIDNVRHEF
ncbi:MAG: hypothetical protein M3Q56_04720 [Bacteroidota bacterium]|nr:hypothetical protein [Bacteroidota bacterium]